jgi:polyisoprenoid-binding protein YceI
MTTIHSSHDTYELTGTRWRLDPARSSASFRVPFIWGLSSVNGRFEDLAGSLEVDDDAHWQIVLALDAASVDTGNPRRDKHLRSATFFDVARHPVVRFRSRGVTERGDRLEVLGELEAAGQRVPLHVEVTLAGADGWLELDAAATVDQRQLGMTYSPLGVIRTPTALSVHARLLPER